MKTETHKPFFFLTQADLFPRDSGLARRFEAERRSLLARAVRIGALLAATLVPLFGILDGFLKPLRFTDFVLIRGGVMAVSVAVYAFTRTAFGRKRPFLLGAFLTLVVGGSIALMCTLDQGPADPYYAGINLPILGFGILLPLTFFEGFCVFLAVWLSYFVPNALVVSAGDIPIFVNNNFFMVSTILISLVASRFHLGYRKREWIAHHRLEKANLKIRRHSRELEHRVQERTQKLIQSERLAVVGQLAGGIAHDFNNHLTAILGMSEVLINQRGIGRSVRQDLEGIRGAGLRASELVKQLLAFSRQQLLNPKVLNLNEVVHDVRKLLHRLIGEDIELVIQTSPDLHAVKVDPIQAEQVLLNLAVNARDAMPNGGRLFIETRNIRLERDYLRARALTVAPGGYVMLAVSDNGIGMDEDVKAKIFEPFFTTKERGQGTGLGLSTVYGIVKQTHGDIIVYSEKNMGTTIKVFLPGIPDQAMPVAVRVKPERLPKGNETILLVEDESSVRDLTARLLKLQGYTVMAAAEAQEALIKVAHHVGDIHLLMTDVVMPNMNGRELADRLTQDRRNLKVLYFSGYTDAFIVKRGILTSNSLFLQKPFTFEDLSRKVRLAIDT